MITKEQSLIRSMTTRENSLEYKKNSSSNKSPKDIENILENERILNKDQPWARLDKGLQIKALEEYANEYVEKSDIKLEGANIILYRFLRERLNRKQLCKAKDVIYNRNTGKIENIMDLFYDVKKKEFIIKTEERRTSPMVSLAPKNTRKIKRNNKLTKVKIIESNE